MNYWGEWGASVFGRPTKITPRHARQIEAVLETLQIGAAAVWGRR